MGKAKKPSLSLVGQLVQDMASKTDPITADEINAFRERPSGPILPHRCVRTKRLDLEVDEEVQSLAVDPRGRWWLTTTRFQKITIRTLNRLVLIDDDITLPKKTGALQSVYPMGFVERIQGSSAPSNCNPLTRIIYLNSGDSGAKFGREQNQIWLGNRRILRDVEGDIEYIVRTTHGYLVVVRDPVAIRNRALLETTDLENGPLKLIRNVYGSYSSLKMDHETGTLFGIFLPEFQDFTAHLPQLEDVLGNRTLHSFGENARTPVLISNGGGVWAYQHAEEGFDTRVWKLGKESASKRTLLKKISYPVLMGDTLIARVGRRHGQESWRFYQTPFAAAPETSDDKFMPAVQETGPVFDKLSRPFQIRNRWHYYGLAGNHLCLMECPPINKAPKPYKEKRAS